MNYSGLDSIDRLNEFCSPVSNFWWKENGCQFLRLANSSTGSCHDAVDLPLCFEDTAILYGITAAFLVLAGFSFVFGGSRHSGTLDTFRLLYAAKLIFLLVPLLTAVSDLVYTIVRGRTETVAHFQYVTPIVIILSMVVCSLVIHRDRQHGHRSSGLMLLFWLGLVIYGSLKLRTYILIARDQNGVEDKFRFSTFCFQYVTYLIQFVLSIIPEGRSNSETSRVEVRRPSPEEDAHFLSRITWWWQNRQIWNGWRRPIKYDDLADLNSVDKSRVVAPRFQRHWDRELKKSNIFVDGGRGALSDNGYYQSFDVRWRSSMEAAWIQTSLRGVAPSTRTGRRQEPSLVWALAKSFGGGFVMAALFKVVHDLLMFASPQLLKLMINFTRTSSAEPSWHGYFYSFLLFLTAVVQSLFLQQYFHRCTLTGMRIRTAILAAVYNKSLRLSCKTHQPGTVRETVNLMSVDAQRITELVAHLHMIWSAPLQIILSLVFLYLTMGPSIFAGFAVMVLMIPLNSCLASWSKRLFLKHKTPKNSRIKLINEILRGIKMIKLYVWEVPFQCFVSALREQELNQVKKTACVKASLSITWICAPFLVALVTFATYALVNLHNPDQRLTADKAFVALSLFNILRFPLAMLPALSSTVIQGYISVKRLRAFLKADELDSETVEWTSKRAMETESAVSVTGGKFYWDSKKQHRPTLNDLNLRVKPGQLVAVVGQVGAGKSSLIQALLGEMEKHGGNVSLKGSVGYVPQQAWIQNTTLKENILFGKALDNMKYGKTIEACALVVDIDALPQRDATLLGEKGINLSGGQKQRVSLARAVYQDSDIYLLDDPLSAVDSHVGKHIFDKVLGPQGMLKNKVRILVTHGIAFLPQCDVIVVMVDGQITEVGSYTELINNDGAFAQFLHTHQNTETDTNTEKEHDLLKFDDTVYSLFPEDPSVSLLPGPADGAEHYLWKTDRETYLSREHQYLEVGSRRQERVKLESDEHSLRSQQLETSSEDKDRHKLTETTTLLVEEEAHPHGSIQFKIIWSYVRACTWAVAVLTLLVYLLAIGASMAAGFWLADWSDAEASAGGSRVNTTICDSENGPSLGCYLGIYAGLGGAQALLILSGTILLSLSAIIASRNLHFNFLKNILLSPLSFFDTTPSITLLTHFSKDMYIIDEAIPRSIHSFIFSFLTVCGIFIVIAIVTPLFIIVLIPLIILYFVIQRFYVATSRQLKRLESVTRSPIYSHFQESITGASSIRAYRQQDRFMKESERRVDYNQIAYYPSICAERWLCIRLELIASLVIFFAALFAAIQRNYKDELNLRINPGLVGLSISYALQITQALNFVVRMASELETNIVAVERIKEYSETPKETAESVSSQRPPEDWPPEGHVKFDQYSTRYREDLDLVLKDIDVDIPGGTKVGIVGRTGAGKSSLTLSMFRIIEAVGGAILIDDINLRQLSLNDLRSKITIIPQEPVFFSGTLRMNLDPFGSYSDSQLWHALKGAHLKNFVAGLEKRLEHQLTERGENISVGQRQLVCLARALLRKTKILVLDEATAAVDLETDDLIQKTIRSEFRECTVITITHRLNTIMDYDRIIVLDNSQVVEYDTPEKLLADRKSLFFSMAKDAGLSNGPVQR